MVFNDRILLLRLDAELDPAPAGQTSVDLQAVVTHEYGHYFGLDHTSVLADDDPFHLEQISQRSWSWTTAPESKIYRSPVTSGGFRRALLIRRHDLI